MAVKNKWHNIREKPPINTKLIVYMTNGEFSQAWYDVTWMYGFKKYIDGGSCVSGPVRRWMLAPK